MFSTFNLPPSAAATASTAPGGGAIVISGYSQKYLTFALRKTKDLNFLEKNQTYLKLINIYISLRDYKHIHI